MEYLKLEDCCEILDSKRIPVTANKRRNGKYPYYGANGLQDYVDDYIFDDELVLLAEDGGNFNSKDKPIAYRVSGKCWVNNHAHVLKPKQGISVDYLCYALMYYDVSGLVNGATRQKLTQATMRKMKIPILSEIDQMRIVEIMNSIQKLKNDYRSILHKIDILIKARFIEMFGDESNPFDWPIVTVDSVADVQVGVVIKPAQYYADRINGIKTFRSLNVGEMNVKDTDWVYFSEEGNRKNIKSILKEHDLLIIRSGTPGTACVIEKQYEGCNAIDLIIAHPNKKYINPYYLCMFTNSALGKRQIDEGTGGAAQQHFNVGKYKKMKIFYPPMAKQQDFECFFKQVDKSRFDIKKSIIELEREVVYD